MEEDTRRKRSLRNTDVVRLGGSAASAWVFGCQHDEEAILPMCSLATWGLRVGPECQVRVWSLECHVLTVDMGSHGRIWTLPFSSSLTVDIWSRRV